MSEVETKDESATLSELQAAEYAMLEFLDQICKERGLKYFLAYGTLLGAVRHKAIIPWDDDVDVFMPLEDFDKLASAWEEIQDGDIVLQCHESDPQYQIEPMRLRMRNTYFPTQTSLNCGWKEQGAWIDIYPLYPQKKKGVYGKFIFSFSLAINTITYHRLYDKSTVYRTNSKPVIVAHKALTLFSKVAPLEVWMSLRRNIRRLGVSKDGNNTRLIHYGGYGYDKSCFDIHWFDSTEYLSFGENKYPVPGGWDNMLTQIYGDYMTPVVRPSALLNV